MERVSRERSQSNIGTMPNLSGGGCDVPWLNVIIIKCAKVYFWLSKLN